ncbi:MAG: hypothetical protein HQK51_08220 [Oligoflexia bacterium]|nr:hypothetical protein [Oligoflexia bacterium]
MFCLKLNYRLPLAMAILSVFSMIFPITNLQADNTITLPIRNLTTANLSQARLSQMQLAFERLNLRVKPVANISSSFILSPGILKAGNKGYVLSIHRAKSISPTGDNKYVAAYIEAGNDDLHFIQFGFKADANKAYVLECEVSGITGQYSAHIQLPGSANIDMTTDSYTESGSNGGAFVLFPIYSPKAGNVYVTFSSPMNHWRWLGCNIIPQK